MDAPSDTIPIIDGVAGLGSDYDVWLCDVWGVMHNGVRAFEGANAACRRFREAGGVVVLVSNAPRPASAVEKGFAQYGVDPQAYDSIVTSGDVTQRLLRAGEARAVHHLGPERDRPIFDGIDVVFAGPDEAEAVVCTGLFDDKSETPDDYRAPLGDMAARRLPMICANPDLMVERGDVLVYCAGALAALYESLGGPVRYAGKPYGPIYDLALERAAGHRRAPVDRQSVLAIGDGLKTDIAGAARAGIDALFVASGLHMGTGKHQQALDAAAVERLFAETARRPRAAISRLAW